MSGVEPKKSNVYQSLSNYFSSYQQLLKTPQIAGSVAGIICLPFSAFGYLGSQAMIMKDNWRLLLKPKSLKTNLGGHAAWIVARQCCRQPAVDATHNFLHKHHYPPGIIGFAEGVAAALADPVVYSIESLRAYAQCKTLTLSGAIAHLYGQYGLLGMTGRLYCGVPPYAMRNALTLAATFSVDRACKEKWHINGWSSLLLGTFAGVIVSMPYEVKRVYRTLKIPTPKITSQEFWSSALRASGPRACAIIATAGALRLGSDIRTSSCSKGMPSRPPIKTEANCKHNLNGDRPTSNSSSVGFFSNQQKQNQQPNMLEMYDRVCKS